MKVLFFGNSQLMVCQLPTMIREMAASAPAEHPRIEIGQVLTGGAWLKTHWTPENRALMADGGWDVVVIQEIYAAKPAEFEPYAALFDDAIRAAGATPLLFATASVTPYYHNESSYSYPESLIALNAMQVEFGRARNIPVAAAGYAWMRYLGPDPSDDALFDLYAQDKGHPGPKGCYINACLLYAVLTGKSPVGLISAFPDIRDGIVIAPEEAARMQQAAWEQYQADHLGIGEPSCT